MTANQIAYQRMREEGRANLAREAETKRANLSQEGLRSQELAELGRHNLAVESETARSNLAREAETNRSNLAKEFENTRSHMASESIQSQSVANQRELGFANLTEASRSNLANESIKHQANVNQRYAATLSDATKRQMTKFSEEQQNWRAKLQAETGLKSSGIRAGSALADTVIKMIGGVFAK